ncbi:MAG: hypothetical protein SVS15_06760, partial [Thermodesulfobacteriota bacterium]|nr:hypothetical protein [Thermodesulfobacteriota bacterium]
NAHPDQVDIDKPGQNEQSGYEVAHAVSFKDDDKRLEKLYENNGTFNEILTRDLLSYGRHNLEVHGLRRPGRNPGKMKQGQGRVQVLRRGVSGGSLPRSD